MKRLYLSGLETLFWQGNDVGFIVRTPYCANSYIDWGNSLNKHFNYTVLVQNVRGRYGSVGDWKPYFNETKDSLIIYEFLQSLFINEVVILGSSYEAYCARILANLLSDKLNVKMVLRVGVRNQQETLFLEDSFRIADYYWWGNTHGKGKESNFSFLPNYDKLKNKVPPIMLSPEKTVFPIVPTIIIAGWKDGYLPYAFDDFFKWKTDIKLIVGDFGHNLEGIQKIFKESEWYDDLLISGKTAIIQIENSKKVIKLSRERFSEVNEKIQKVTFSKNIIDNKKTVNDLVYITPNQILTINLNAQKYIISIVIEHNTLSKNIFGNLIVGSISREFIMTKGEKCTVISPLLIDVKEIKKIDLRFSTSLFPRYTYENEDSVYLSISTIKTIDLGDIQ